MGRVFPPHQRLLLAGTGVQECLHTLPSPSMGSCVTPLPQFPPCEGNRGTDPSLTTPLCSQSFPEPAHLWWSIMGGSKPLFLHPGLCNTISSAMGRARSPAPSLSSLPMPCSCPVSAWPSPSPSTAEAMLHPDPATRHRAEHGGPLVPSPAPVRSPCPSAAAETHQASCPPCSAPCPSPVPCLAQPDGHPIPWQCGLAESWCNSSAPSEGENLPRSALRPPSSSSARSWAP